MSAVVPYFRAESKELKEFVYKVDAPVTDTLMGKGAFDGTDEHIIQECLVCMVQRQPNLSVTECDLLIVLGARFSVTVLREMQRNLQKNAKIVQIDVDPAEINKKYSGGLFHYR